MEPDTAFEHKTPLGDRLAFKVDGETPFALLEHHHAAAVVVNPFWLVLPHAKVLGRLHQECDLLLVAVATVLTHYFVYTFPQFLCRIARAGRRGIYWRQWRCRAFLRDGLACSETVYEAQ